MQRYGTVTDGNTMLDATVLSKGFFKCCDITPGGGNPASTDSLSNVFQLVARKHGLADGEEANHGTIPIF